MPNKKRSRILIGSRGGRYIIKNGKKLYKPKTKRQRFGVTSEQKKAKARNILRRGMRRRKKTIEQRNIERLTRELERFSIEELRTMAIGEWARQNEIECIVCNDSYEEADNLMRVGCDCNFTYLCGNCTQNFLLHTGLDQRARCPTCRSHFYETPLSQNQFELLLEAFPFNRNTTLKKLIEKVKTGFTKNANT